jgi:hypothetical protein
MTTALYESPTRIETIPAELRLVLRVRDAEIVADLYRRDEGEPRDTFALSALRLGVLALRQAAGVIDRVTVRHEGERLVASIRELLLERSTQLMQQLAGSLKQYFDPADGQLPQRLDRLLKRDGELESLLSRHLGDDGSTLAKTLALHVGESSPLMKVIAPDEAGGVIAALTETIQQALNQQREHVLGQFSLDDENSALSHLVKQIADANGKFRTDLSGDIDKLCGEFSLDNEEGALARLVRQVERAQKSIADQFSNDNENSALRKMSKLLESTNAAVKASLTLDDDKSPLSRLRNELLKVLNGQTDANRTFQTEVRETLAAMKARREESERSTRHGGEFQDAVGEVVQADAQRHGDIFVEVGDTAGKISRCKVGDHIVTLGPDSAAAGANIVCEAKADQSVNLQDALAEIKQARENRAAQVGVFIFSAAVAPAGLDPLKRYENDIIVVWTQDDPASDIFLKCALSVARALAVRQAKACAEATANFEELDAAIQKVAKDATDLNDVVTWANTIQSNGKKIVDRVDKIRDDLEKQAEMLRDHVGRLKGTLKSPGIAGAE